MRTINSTPSRPGTTDRADGPSVRSDDRPTRRSRPHHVADAVIAGYIHDVSHSGRRGSGRRTSRKLIAQPV